MSTPELKHPLKLLSVTIFGIKNQILLRLKYGFSYSYLAIITNTQA